MPSPRRAGRSRQPSEKQEQAAIVKLLRMIGGHVYVIGTTRRRGDYHGTMQTPGLPDLYVLLPKKGAFDPSEVWVEVKKDGGRVRKEQEAFRLQCVERGVRHILGGHDRVAEFLKYWGFLR